jgi:hypothetical protein
MATLVPLCRVQAEEPGPKFETPVSLRPDGAGMSTNSVPSPAPATSGDASATLASATPSTPPAPDPAAAPGTPPASPDLAAAPPPAPSSPDTAGAPGPNLASANPPLPPSAPAPTSDAAADPTPSQSVTINLIHLMVTKHLITQTDADGLIKQAEQEAATARATAQAAAKSSAETASSTENAASAAPADSSLPEENVPDDTVHVAYVPDVVKNQIRDEVTEEVMKKEGGGLKTNEGPALTATGYPIFRVHGDIRVRYDGNFFPDGNDNTGGLPNFNAINTGAPFNTAGVNFPAENDVDQNRTRFRLRARLGTEIDFGDGFTAGLRAGTGSDDSPVTENQTLGGANNGQGGDFAKYQIWLDRGYIRYQYGVQPDRNVTMSIGRFDNPFYSTTMIWADDIGFDGLALKANYKVANGVVPFLIGGAFPVFNTDFNFASNQPEKFSSQDKYLMAGQGGVNWQITPDFHTTLAVSDYYFKNMAGRLSSPFTPLSAADVGDTDDTRPSFAQNGNTYRPIRDIVPDAANDFGTINQYQYYGLATQFNEVALTGQIDYSHFDPFHLALIGEAVENTAFDRNAVASIAVNNQDASGNFNGGNMGYNIRLVVGQAALNTFGDWNVAFGYRYIESDAVVDAFNDADFGGPLTGTNLKGYTLEGNFAITKYIWSRLRFYSSNSIAGGTYKNDLIQFDINAHF